MSSAFHSFVVSCFLNNGEGGDKIEKIVGCNTIYYFVEDDELMFIFVCSGVIPNLSQIVVCR